MSNQTYSAYISGPLSKRKEFGIDILESAALDAGFSIVRRTNLASSSRLNQEIVNSLRKADIVLADITGNPAHVLYEVGFAQSLEKPVLFIEIGRAHV